jgi:hypothetical protein
MAICFPLGDIEAGPASTGSSFSETSERFAKFTVNTVSSSNFASVSPVSFWSRDNSARTGSAFGDREQDIIPSNRPSAARRLSSPTYRHFGEPLMGEGTISRNRRKIWQRASQNRYRRRLRAAVRDPSFRSRCSLRQDDRETWRRRIALLAGETRRWRENFAFIGAGAAKSSPMRSRRRRT